MNKDSLIFYLSQYEAIKTLNNEQLGRLFRALFEKQLQNNSKTTEKEVVLEDDIKIAFNFINNQLVIDKNKYTKKCETNRNNGKKGGAPLGNKNALKQPKQPKQPNGLKNNPNDNENDNDNDNDYKNISTTTPTIKRAQENLFEFIENVFGRTLSGSEFEVISQWEDNELTRYAIKQAELARAFNVKYIERILFNYKKENIETVTQAEERDRRWQEQNDNSKKNYSKKKTVQEELKEMKEKIKEGKENYE